MWVEAWVKVVAIHLKETGRGLIFLDGLDLLMKL